MLKAANPALKIPIPNNNNNLLLSRPTSITSSLGSNHPHNNLRNNHSSYYSNTSHHFNESSRSDSELQFRISGLDHERSTMPQVVNSQIEALMAERDQRALLGGVGDAPNNNDKRTGSNVWNPAFETSLYRKIVMGKRPTIPDDCSSSLADLIQACWSGDPSKRPTFRDISKKLELQIQLE